MNATHDSVCARTDEGTQINWTNAEARFQRAKQALLDIQQQHCDAAHELLLARAQVRQTLEAAFPGAERTTGWEADLIQPRRHPEGSLLDGGKSERLGQALVSAGKGLEADVR